MHSLCLLIALLAQTGPKPLELKGLRRLPPMSALTAETIRTSLKEIGGGAVVVVEDLLPVVVMPEVFTGLRLLGGKLQLFNRQGAQPYDLPVASWMDKDTVYAGGQVVSRTYPLGWGY